MSRVETVGVPVGDHRLPADLAVPPAPAGIVVFAHGSGSGRGSPRNRTVAAALLDGGIGTLLVDLMRPHEDTERRFDAGLLGARVVATIDWLRGNPDLGRLRVGCFGASTGAAAALVAAAARPDRVDAVVSRGGRPDLAGDALPDVRAATLLIVGGEDRDVLALNRTASERMTCEPVIEVIPGASHLFSEPGALERVGELATDWFSTRLRETA
jgi:dienelactone hydrolase